MRNPTRVFSTPASEGSIPPEREEALHALDYADLTLSEQGLRLVRRAAANVMRRFSCAEAMEGEVAEAQTKSASRGTVPGEAAFSKGRKDDQDKARAGPKFGGDWKVFFIRLILTCYAHEK